MPKSTYTDESQIQRPGSLSALKTKRGLNFVCSGILLPQIVSSTCLNSFYFSFLVAYTSDVLIDLHHIVNTKYFDDTLSIL